MAVWVRDENPDNASVGAGVHGSGRDVMADGNAKAGSYDVVAVLARQPESISKTVQETAGNGGGVEFHRVGAAGRSMGPRSCRRHRNRRVGTGRRWKRA